jgi:hypothetical protein
MSEINLRDLPFTPEEKDKISQLGVDNPSALLGMIKAAPQQSEDYFGKERCAEIEKMLRNSISDREREIIDAPPTKFSTGARLEHLVRE